MVLIPQECNAFTQKYTGRRVNRIITAVKISVAFHPNNRPPNVQFYETPALWDTGATHSIITDATVQAMGLVPTGQRMVQHGGGQSQHNTHVVNFYLPNQVAIGGVIVTEHPANDGSFGAIIGMDIIMGGDLAITNHKGESWMTFRYPSIEGCDYVADFKKLSQPAVSNKVSRNAKCPCGSNKKYKYCHGQSA